tara:strand:+ start:337 stop:558 length:222 start_codon:yes stop_codon:yes gene_type:complete
MKISWNKLINNIKKTYKRTTDNIPKIGINKTDNIINRMDLIDCKYKFSFSRPAITIIVPELPEDNDIIPPINI